MSTTPAKNLVLVIVFLVIAGVVDTGDKFIVDTGDQLSASIGTEAASIGTEV